MKILFLFSLLFPLFATAQIRPYVEPVPPPSIKYNWKGAIAPASLAFAAGAAGDRYPAGRFLRQGFAFGAVLTIGFADPKRPAWHYIADVGVSCLAFGAGHFAADNLFYR